MSILEDLVKPFELERDLKNETEIDQKIDYVVATIGKLLKMMQVEECQKKIFRLKENPFDKELTFQSLLHLYGNLHTVTQRVLAKSGEAGSLGELMIGNRPVVQILEQAVDQMIFLHERDELLAPVSAMLGKRKGDYGPAMYSEYVKRVGRNLISSINSQINELLPTVTKICKAFSGISNQFVPKEARDKNERQKYEDVWLIYQAEKAAKERIDEIASITKDKIGFFENLLEDFSKIKTAYREKIESLEFLREETQSSLDELLAKGDETTEKLDLEKQIVTLDGKLKKLNTGNRKLLNLERILLMLKNLIEKFPGIENQIEFFIESDYQAKSVYKFLEEISLEMKGIFGQQNIQAFEVIAALVYKLKATSLMYENANYYQATIRMVDDVSAFLQRTLTERREKSVPAKVSAIVKNTGLESGVLKIHETMNHFKELNNHIHQVLVDFGDKYTDRAGKENVSGSPENIRDELKNTLENDLAAAKKLSENSIFPQYQTCQKQFQNFTEANLEEKHIGEQVVRAFMELSGREEAMPMKKEELLNFQKFKLFTQMAPDNNVQQFFSGELKKFMRGEPCEEMTPSKIRLRFISEIAEIEEKEKEKENALSRHASAIRFISENLTPKEIESLARFVPCMPRNELRLTFPPGRLFIEIAEKHMEFLRSQSQIQYVLINPGEERKNENEITFKELSRKELIKKAYGILYRQLETAYNRIQDEKSREVDFILRERNKWRKELDQVVLHLQYQINALADDGILEEGKFRKYSAEEVGLMAKHISPDQFDKIESLFGKKFTIEKDSALADVVIFLVQIIRDFNQLMEQDELIRAEFEEIQAEKKKIHLGGKTEHIDQRSREVEIVIQQKKIDHLLAFWEFGINKILPSSEQVLKKEVEAIHYSSRDLENMATDMLPEQLTRIRENLSIINNNAVEKQRPILIARGRPLLKIAQVCFDILEKDEALVVSREDVCRKQLSEFTGDEAFKENIDRMLSGTPESISGEIEKKISDDNPVGETPGSSISKQVDLLINVLCENAPEEPYPSNLPKVTNQNLNQFVQHINKDQIARLAAFFKGRIQKEAVTPLERRLIIIAYHHLRGHPDAVSERERKQVLLRYRDLQAAGQSQG